MPQHDDFSDLDELQPAWVEADDTIGMDVPDGTYQARIDKIELARIKSGQHEGKPTLHWELIIIGPTHEGRRLFDNQNILDNNLSFIKSRLAVLDLHPEKLGDLRKPSFREKALDLCVEVHQVTKPSKKDGKEYTNLYFRKLLDIEADTTPDQGRGF